MIAWIDFVTLAYVIYFFFCDFFGLFSAINLALYSFTRANIVMPYLIVTLAVITRPRLVTVISFARCRIPGVSYFCHSRRHTWMTLTSTLTETLPGWTWVRVSSFVSIGPAVWPAMRNKQTDRQTNKHIAFYYIDCPALQHLLYERKYSIANCLHIQLQRRACDTSCNKDD